MVNITSSESTSSHQPSSTQVQNRRGLLTGFLIVSLSLLIIAIGALLVTPQYAKLFENFGADLPWLTLAFIAWAKYMGILPMMSGIIAFYVWRRGASLAEHDGILTMTLIMFAIVAFAIVPIAVVALYLPIFKLGSVV